MDKSWMHADRRWKEYELGVERFLKFALENASNPKLIHCPCVKCGNIRQFEVGIIRDHLYYNGIDQSYKLWVWHGEPSATIQCHEDILQFSAMAEIGVNVIATYMRYLYNMLKKSNMLRMVGLVDPARVSANCGPYSQRSRHLASRFETGDPDQIFLVPYNTGCHWVLAIVNPHKEAIYYMDSLYRRINDEEFKNVLNTAIKVFNAQMNKAGRKQPQWKILQGTPRQPMNVECGYYVMRFMKEIVEDSNLEFIHKWEKGTEHSYSQEQLDEVRSEWSEFVSDLM